MSKFKRIDIPKSEEDVRRITEEIMKQEMVKEEAEEIEEHKQHGVSNTELIAQELGHVQELLLHLIQSIRELRDSVDTLALIVKKSLRAIALLQLMNMMNDENSRMYLLEQVSKDLGIEIKKLKQ